jgi:hypothetical protein
MCAVGDRSLFRYTPRTLKVLIGLIYESSRVMPSLAVFPLVKCINSDLSALNIAPWWLAHLLHSLYAFWRLRRFLSILLL